MVIADLHIHSRYSRATSRDLDAPHLDMWARKKGIGLIGTGDFTHPAWRQELAEQLVPAEEGLYRLKDELRLSADVAGEEPAPRFVLSAEISCIYKKGDRVRKVHNVILLPGLEEAESLSHRLEAIGNIHSDGRPILGLDSRDLLEITLDVCPQAIFIPAHIWTPHFSMFGAFSGFQTVEDCFEDLTPYIHAVETGLSSDPPMNWRVSQLDRYTLVSHSDAHSPQKLGREADLFDIPLSYAALKQALDTGEGMMGTVEFFPEEGKYHLDGHRNCGVCLTPEETIAYGGKCPVCGRKITVGVEHRIEELADRPAGYRPPHAKPFESLVPLQEVIAASAGIAASGKKAAAMTQDLLRLLGPEFTILRDLPLEDIERQAGGLIAEGIRRLRNGDVRRTPGYDGEYGKVALFDEDERDYLKGQMSLFGTAGTKPVAKKQPVPPKPVSSVAKLDRLAVAKPAVQLNTEQRQAVEATDETVTVIAGPGTGKTATLVARIAHLVEEQGVRPADITAVTFTNQAAGEMRERLEQRLGRRAARAMTIGTFHAICLQLLEKDGARPVLISESEARDVAANVLREYDGSLSAQRFLQAVSRRKNGMDTGEPSLPDSAYERYDERLRQQGVLDFDDLLCRALEKKPDSRGFSHLLVDEFQDINAVQFQLVCAWSQQADSLFVIGDPDQSIYGFRGASAAWFQQLAEARPNTRTIRLVQNYRSTPPIIGCALAAIEPNGGEPRILQSQKPAGEPVRLLTADSDFAEAVFVAKEIARMTGGLDMVETQGAARKERTFRAFDDVAVLCRTHRQLELLEKCLRRDSIPCVISGREDYLMADDVRGVLGFFGWLCQKEDGLSLQTALTRLFACPADLCERAMAFCQEHPHRPLEEWEEAFNGFPQLARWLAAVKDFSPLLGKQKPRKLMEQLIASLRLPLSAALERLLNAAVFHNRMVECLQTLLLGEEADVRRTAQKSYSAGAVRLMTLHGAKGLEFPVVFLCGVKDGTLPYTSKKHPTNEQEERRLFYVGITRAREELWITTTGEPSAFLQDLPADVRASALSAPGKQPFRQMSLFE